MPLAFSVPDVQDNADGWGPSTVPEHLKDVPFAPFSKSDKVGRAADWTQSAYHNKFPGRYGQQSNPVNAVFNFFHNEEEDSFHLVDNRQVKTPKYGPRRFQYNKFQNQRRDGRDGRDGRNDGKDGDIKKRPQHQKRNPFQFGREMQRQVTYSSSVDIRPEWAVREQIPFTSLMKLTCNVGEPTDVRECGSLDFYDKSYDRLAPKAEKPLEKTKRAFRSVTTSDDPIVRQLAADDSARVFVTDSLLTTLMCVKSSVYSWDMLITRVGDKVFFDRRDGSSLGLLTVNETAPEPVSEDKDNINGVQHLALEATTINQNFSQQVLMPAGGKFTFSDPNPFASPDDEEELASVAYRYRKWTLDKDGGVDVVVRCELEGAITNKGETALLSIKALNEFDLRATDWRKKLESQRGAVLAFETKNNKNKVAKWTAGALLAGADMLKLGYVSRTSPKDNQNHYVLGTQVCKPKDFAGQINLNMDHCWGIFRALVDILLRMEEGKYLLVKDPNKELLRLYAIPDNAFEAHYADEPLDTTTALPSAAAPAAADEDV